MITDKTILCKFKGRVYTFVNDSTNIMTLETNYLVKSTEDIVRKWPPFEVCFREKVKQIQSHHFSLREASGILSISQASESKQFFATRGVFFHYFLNTLMTNWAQNFHRFFILCICWGTPSEDTGLLAITKSLPCL